MTMDPDLLKQFLPQGVSVDQHWLKMTVAICGSVAAWLIARGMPPAIARDLVWAIAVMVTVTIGGISHVQAARLNGAAKIGQGPAMQTNVDSSVTNAPAKPKRKAAKKRKAK